MECLIFGLPFHTEINPAPVWRKLKSVLRNLRKTKPVSMLAACWLTLEPFRETNITMRDRSSVKKLSESVVIGKYYGPLKQRNADIKHEVSFLTPVQVDSISTRLAASKKC